MDAVAQMLKILGDRLRTEGAPSVRAFFGPASTVMELPTSPALPLSNWARLAPCERDALDALRTVLREREDAGGRLALEGLALFSVRRGGAVEAYLSPDAVVALAPHLDGLPLVPSPPPPDAPGIKLEEGDAELWVAVVRRPDRAQPEA